jgi:hypothetical protein
MKNIKLAYLVAGLLIVSAPTFVVAQDSTNTPPAAPAAPAAHPHAGGQAALLKAIGLTREDLKGLSPEDRKAKVKSAADAKFAALKAKTDLTDAEKKDLAVIQKFEDHAKKSAAQ